MPFSTYTFLTDHYLHLGLSTVAGLLVAVSVVQKAMRYRLASGTATHLVRSWQSLAFILAMLTEILAVLAIVSGTALTVAAIGLAGYVVVVAAYTLSESDLRFSPVFSAETLKDDLMVIAALVVLLTFAFALRF